LIPPLNYLLEPAYQTQSTGHLNQKLYPGLIPAQGITVNFASSDRGITNMGGKPCPDKQSFLFPRKISENSDNINIAEFCGVEMCAQVSADLQSASLSSEMIAYNPEAQPSQIPAAPGLNAKISFSLKSTFMESHPFPP
jgi:hypothetical protein